MGACASAGCTRAMASEAATTDHSVRRTVAAVRRCIRPLDPPGLYEGSCGVPEGLADDVEADLAGGAAPGAGAEVDVARAAAVDADDDVFLAVAAQVVGFLEAA